MLGIVYRVLERTELGHGQGHPCFSDVVPAQTPDFFVIEKSYWFRHQEMCFDDKKFGHESIDRIQQCGRRVQDKMKKAVEFWVYLDISCKKINLENRTYLFHYTNVLVALNRVAAFVRKIVYANNAFEYKTISDIEGKNQDRKPCGWWKLGKTNGSNETYKIEDRVIRK